MGRVANAVKKAVTKAAKPAKTNTPKKTVDRSFSATVLREYDGGSPFAEIAEKHECAIEKVQAIVEADQAKNEVK